MKEKLKKLFTSKAVWEYIVGFICLFFVLTFTYSKGFVDGLLIDNEIRQEFIDSTTDFNLSNNDIEIDKKDIIENNPPTSIIPNEFYLGTLALPWGSTSYTGGDNAAFYYVCFNYTIGASYDGLEQNLVIDYVNVSYSFEVYVHTLGGSNLFRSYRYNEITSFDFNYHIVSTDNSDYYLPLLMLQFDLSTGVPNAYLGLLNTQKQLIDETKTLYSDSAFFQGLLYFINTSYETSRVDLSNSFGQYDVDYAFDFIEPLINLDSNNNYISPYYLQFSNNTFNSLIVASFGNSGGSGGGGADDGYTQADLDEAYNNGISKGKEIRDLEYQQTDTFFNKMWAFIETATEKTLAVFNINILPGIPLYFLVVIPISIGLIGWLFKLLQR